MGLRHLGRELALKALYQIDVGGDPSNDALLLFFDSFPAEQRSRDFASQLVVGVRGELAELDRQIGDCLKNWATHRLSRIDHNILRLGLYELQRMADVPARVTMDEAIELAKRYGARDSGPFVNGVLDELAGRLGLRTKGDDVVINGKAD